MNVAESSQPKSTAKSADLRHTEKLDCRVAEYSGWVVAKYSDGQQQPDFHQYSFWQMSNNKLIQSPSGVLPAGSQRIQLFAERVRIVFPTILYQNHVVLSVHDFILVLVLEVGRLGHTVRLVVVVLGVGDGVEAVQVQNQDILVILFVALDEVSEIGRACDFHSIFKEDVIPIGVLVFDDSQEARKFGHGCKDAHVLGPAVPEDVLGRQKSFIAEPLVHGAVEKQHTGIHVDATFVVDQLMTHHVGHSRHLGVTGELVAAVDIHKQLITQGESFTCDICLGPYFEPKVRIQLLVQFYNLALAFRHLALYPDQMDDLGYDVRFVPERIGLALDRVIIDCEIRHTLSVLYEMVHAVGHGVNVMLVVVHGDFLTVHLLPPLAVYHHFSGDLDTVGHVEDIVAGFDEPLDFLGVVDLRAVVFFGEVDYHLDEGLQKFEPVVVVLPFVGEQCELRQDFVAV